LRTLFPALALATLAVAAYVALAEPPQPPKSVAHKIADASRAAPMELVAGATLLDWPEETGGEFRVLREGTNGWNCLPDFPGDSNYAPECFDDEWLAFLKAYLEGQSPSTKRIGLSYMLNARWAVSNTDRTATAPTAHNQWHEGGSHLMLVVPDPAMLEWFPTEPTPKGGAYVMYSGTPYAHLMIPIPEAHSNQE
jgi:hypothetical protein